MADKYPEFYIRKRQKEEAYRRTVQIVVGVVIFALIGGLGGFFVYKYWLQPRRQPAPAPEQLADERQELETQSALSSAAGQRTDSAQAGQQAAGSQLVGVDLGDIPYDPSFPLVQVGIEGSDTSVALEGAEQSEEPAAQPGEDSKPPEAAKPPEAVTPPSDRQQQDTFDRPGSASAGNSGSNSNQNSGSGQESAEDKQPAPPKDEKAPVADESSESSGSNVFHVYAGTYATREEAEAAKSDLQALGFQSQIIDVNIEFHVKVASMDDFDRARAIKEKLVDSGFTQAFATRSRQ